MKKGKIRDMMMAAYHEGWYDRAIHFAGGPITTAGAEWNKSAALRRINKTVVNPRSKKR